MQKNKAGFVVKLNKKKMALLFFTSLTITACSIWLFLMLESENSAFFYVGKFLALLAALFFAVSLIYSTIKLLDTKPALVIDDEGVKDNSSAVAVPLVEWKDINEVKVMIIKQTSFLLIFVDDPEKVLSGRNNFIKRILMKINNRIFKTPVVISATSIDYDFMQVVRLIVNKAKAFNKQPI